MLRAASTTRAIAAAALLVAALGLAACGGPASVTSPGAKTPATSARKAAPPTVPSADATATHEATVLAHLTASEQLGALVPIYKVGPDWFATGTPTPGTIQRVNDAWLVVVLSGSSPSRLFFMGNGTEFPRGIDKAKDDMKDGMWYREDSDAVPLTPAAFTSASAKLHAALPSIEATAFVAANQQTSGWLLGQSGSGSAAALMWAYDAKIVSATPVITLAQLLRAREATGAVSYMFY